MKGRLSTTPRSHEHACVRFPALWPESSYQALLAELGDDLTEGIAYAGQDA